MAGIPQQQLEQLKDINAELDAIHADMGHGGGPVDLGPIVDAIAAGFAAVVGAIESSNTAILAKLDATNALLQQLVDFQTPEPPEQAADLGLAGGEVVPKPPQ